MDLKYIIVCYVFAEVNIIVFQFLSNFGVWT